jgi:Pentapeptide repeats (8 copies)
MLRGLSYGASVNRQVFDGQDLMSVRTQRLWSDHCSFVGADLRHATLDGCSFKICDFRDTDLRDADLTGGRLGYVNTGAHPYGLTDITGAKFDNAVLGDLQVDQVVGWCERERSAAVLIQHSEIRQRVVGQDEISTRRISKVPSRETWAGIRHSQPPRADDSRTPPDTDT